MNKMSWIILQINKGKFIQPGTLYHKKVDTSWQYNQCPILQFDTSGIWKIDINIVESVNTTM